jgi:hypothetical protein
MDYNVNVGGQGTDLNKMDSPSREQLEQLADLVTWYKTRVVPGGFTTGKPIFPADSSLGTLQVGRKVSPAQDGVRSRRNRVPRWV